MRLPHFMNATGYDKYERVTIFSMHHHQHTLTHTPPHRINCSVCSMRNDNVHHVLISFLFRWLLYCLWMILWFSSHTHRIFSSTRNGIAKFTNKMKPEKKEEKKRKKKLVLFFGDWPSTTMRHLQLWNWGFRNSDKIEQLRSTCLSSWEIIIMNMFNYFLMRRQTGFHWKKK